MAKGVSVHIGINEVDPAHYGGWTGALNACEADAAPTGQRNSRHLDGFYFSRLHPSSRSDRFVHGCRWQSLSDAASQNATSALTKT